MTTLREAAEQALNLLEDFEAGQQQVIDAIAALRQALEAEQQAEQATWYHKHWGEGDDIFYLPTDTIPDGATPLYTHSQPVQQPLTDEQIRELMNQADDECMANPDSQAPWSAKPWSTRFARAIERAHGIGGEA